MGNQLIAQWIELIRPVFPIGANIENIPDKGNNIIFRVDWLLGNDPARPNKPSRIIFIIIPIEYIKDCQDFLTAGMKFKKIIENKFSNFNPNHDHSKLVSPPTEEWVIPKSVFET